MEGGAERGTREAEGAALYFNAPSVSQRCRAARHLPPLPPQQVRGSRGRKYIWDPYATALPTSGAQGQGSVLRLLLHSRGAADF